MSDNNNSINSIELQMISKILTSQSEEEIDALCSFDESYYGIFVEHIKFILEHRKTYHQVPDIFTFRAKFPNINIVQVNEPIEYLCSEIIKQKRRILLRDMFDKIKDLGSGDVDLCWEFIRHRCNDIEALDNTKPIDLVADAEERAEQVEKFSQQDRIPTGFPEIDKLMYGGLSTIEELLIIVARTNTGKSWICTKMMESAQKCGFPVLYYSPEMQASYLGTRFDTWRSHFNNTNLFLGRYDEAYKKYIEELRMQPTSAYVLEDKDVEGGIVTVDKVSDMVKKYKIKLLIIDGLSYMTDIRHATTDHERYRNICHDLFRLSKQYGCAVVIAMQANRETKDCKDEKGEPFPGIMQIEGSDHPARIATQVFAVRQIFDKHVLDIRLEKSRNANNQKPVLSYSWDVNTGNMQYLPNGDDSTTTAPNSVAPSVSIQSVLSHNQTPANTDLDDDDFDEGEVEF